MRYRSSTGYSVKEKKAGRRGRGNAPWADAAHLGPGGCSVGEHGAWVGVLEHNPAVGGDRVVGGRRGRSPSFGRLLGEPARRAGGDEGGVTGAILGDLLGDAPDISTKCAV